MFPFPGKLRLRGEVAALGAEVAESEAGIVAEDLVFQIKQAYDELYRVQEQASLVTQFQAELRNFEEVAATQYEVGNGLQQSILKAQLERNALNIRLEKLEEEGRSALERLAFLLDRPDLSGLRGKTVDRTPDVTPAGDVLDRALIARPEAEALRTEIERSDRRVDLAVREFLPDFMVSVNYFDIGEGGPMPTATGRDAIALNIGVKLPLWLGKQRANLEQARLERSRSEARLQSLRTSIRTEIEDLRNRLERQEQQLSLLENDLIPQARTTVAATLSAYTTGRTSFLDLLDAERMLFNLRMEQVDTRTRYLKTTAALERALGSSFSR
jgi:outer membrane protein TolC